VVERGSDVTDRMDALIRGLQTTAEPTPEVL
jgi:hypothetical protein